MFKRIKKFFKRRKYELTHEEDFECCKRDLEERQQELIKELKN